MPTARSTVPTARSALEDSERCLAATRSVLEQAKRRLADAQDSGAADREALDVLAQGVRNWESAATHADDELAYWNCKNDR